MPFKGKRTKNFQETTLFQMRRQRGQRGPEAYRPTTTGPGLWVQVRNNWIVKEAAPPCVE